MDFYKILSIKSSIYKTKRHPNSKILEVLTDKPVLTAPTWLKHTDI